MDRAAYRARRREQRSPLNTLVEFDADLELHVSTDGAQKVARLKLSCADGEHQGANEIRLPEHSSALWEGLFDTHRYIDR